MHRLGVDHVRRAIAKNQEIQLHLPDTVNTVDLDHVRAHRIHQNDSMIALFHPHQDLQNMTAVDDSIGNEYNQSINRQM